MIPIEPIITALLFYLLPLLLGAWICRLIPAKWKIPTETPPVWFAIGALTLFGIVLLSPIIKPVISFIPLTTLKTGIICVIVFGLLWELIANRKLLRHIIIPIILLVGFSLASYAIWRIDSPYPYALNWDIYEHQLLSNIIQGGHISFVTSRLSDTFLFNGYSTMFHSLLAVPQWIFPSDTLGFWWIVELFHLMTATYAAYLLGLTLTGKRWVGLLSGAVSCMVFESVIVFGAYFLIPQTLSAVLCAGILATLIAQPHDTPMKRILPILIPSLIAIVLTHYIVGIAASAILLTYLFLQKFPILDRKHIFLILTIVSPVALAIGIGVAANAIGAKNINMGEAGTPYFSQSFSEKLSLFFQWYGVGGFMLFALGLFFAPRLIPETRSRRAFILVTSATLGVVYASAPYMLKFYALGRYLVPTVIALGVTGIIQIIHSRVLRICIILMWIIILLSSFVTGIHKWKQSFTFAGIASQVSNGERLAAHYLARTYDPKTTFLVSDPATSYVLEPISGINSQGGAYMNKHSRKAIELLMRAQSPEEFRQLLVSISDTVETKKPTDYLFVASGRLFRWLEASSEEKASIAFDIWRPTDLTMEDRITIAHLKASYGLKEVFSNATMVILK